MGGRRIGSKKQEFPKGWELGEIGENFAMFCNIL